MDISSFHEELMIMNNNCCAYKNYEFIKCEPVDYYVMIGFPEDGDVYVPKKTIILQMEPWVYDNTKPWGIKTWGIWANPSTDKFMYVRKHTESLNPAQWMFTIPKTINIYRLDKFAIVISSKTHDIGHQKRINLVKYIESRNDDIIDVFGYENYHSLNSYVGQIHDKVFLQNYKYVLSVENNSEHNYATEKIWEPLVLYCYTFYDGCPNLDEYIHHSSFESINICEENYEKIYIRMREVINNNTWLNRLQYIKDAKKKIINNYNMFEVIFNYISK